MNRFQLGMIVALVASSTLMLVACQDVKKDKPHHQPAAPREHGSPLTTQPAVTLR